MNIISKAGKYTFLLSLLSCISIQSCADANFSVEAAYILYGQSSDGKALPMARVILDGTDQKCPSLLAATGDSPKINMTARSNPDTNHFPVTVCEAVYPFGKAMKVDSTTITLPVANKDISTVLIFGDTGCKPSDQDCSLASIDWPFPSLTKKAAQLSTPPDVILHMGDYNYSGTPGSINIQGSESKVQVYDAGDNTLQGLCQIPGPYYGQNSVGSQFPDSWAHWQSDFFSAAQPLFSKAPWVFTRGNHELCSRAGPGWFYFLDPNSTLLGKYNSQLSCPPASNPTPEVLSPPYVLGFSKLNIAVVDSANACDYGLLYSDSYINQFSLLQRMIRNAGNKQTWVQTHRPLWGVDQLDTNGACGSDSGDKYCFVNQTMQYANRQSPLPTSVNLIVSGHMHHFQVSVFKSSKHPDQLVVGNSGVKLSGSHPKEAKTLEIDGHEAIVTGLKQFGFMSIQLSGKDNWTGQLLNPTLDTPILMNCDSKKMPVCEQPGQ